MTIPRTVETLEESFPMEGADLESGEMLENARNRVPSNDQSQWNTITVEVHEEEKKENECSWAEESMWDN